MIDISLVNLVDTSVQAPVLSHHVPDLEAAANAFKGSVEQESAVHKQVAGRPRATTSISINLLQSLSAASSIITELADMLD